jgi:hypothetical protein
VTFFGLSHGQLPAQVSPTAKQSLNSAFHTVNVKLVFACRGSLHFVDFAEDPPQIHRINGVDSAFYPVISSDGKWITYQTDNNFEGPSLSPTPGKVWMRELAASGTPVKVADTGYVPRFIQNTPSDSPEIIYSTSLSCPGGACFSSGKTVKRRLSNKSPQAAQTVFENGSYFGGLSWDNRFLCTGWPSGPNVFLLDLQNVSAGPRPVHSMRVKKAATNADTFVAIGGCNISRSASAIFTDNVLYYDFSSNAIANAGCVHPLLGEWGEHAKLFISRYDGEDLKVFDMPADRPVVSSDIAEGKGEAIERRWSCPEWSNHPYYAVAGLLISRLFDRNGNWEHTENNEVLYAISLKDSAFIRLVESTDTSFTSTVSLSSPFLWVEKPHEFQEDSVWLKTTIWQRARNAVLQDPQPRQGRWNDGPQKNGAAVTGASLFSPLGRKIATIKPSEIGRIRGKAAGFPHSGIYLLRIELKEGNRQVYRVVAEQ